MNNIAVITARGGSKRIPRKNIRLFRGKPIIAYSIQTAIASGLFDLVMVSTDDREIADIAIQHGARVPFFRNPATADDYTGTAAVMIEVINELKHIGSNFSHACCIYPTAPLISVDSLLKAFEMLTERNFTTVFPVCSFNYPVQRGLQMMADGSIEMMWPENLNKRSQDLTTAYHDAGQFYWMNIEKFLTEERLFTSDSGAIILDELQVQDIDDETDWKLAEIKHAILFPDE